MECGDCLWYLIRCPCASSLFVRSVASVDLARRSFARWVGLIFDDFAYIFDWLMYVYFIYFLFYLLMGFVPLQKYIDYKKSFNDILLMFFRKQLRGTMALGVQWK